MTLPTDLLDDLSTRFILNMPSDERNDLIRVCFQIEAAYWFYLDFYCSKTDQQPKLVRMNFGRFAHIMFNHVPSLQPLLDDFEVILNKWYGYKCAVPCCGGILLDHSMQYVLLVQGMSKNWSFPKGKMNEGESLIDCAIREVLEEAGYDCSKKVSRENCIGRKISGSRICLFVVKNVELNYDFQVQCRGEINKIEWFRISELMKLVNRKASNASMVPFEVCRFLTVIPFLNDLRDWIYADGRRMKEQKILPRRVLQRVQANENENNIGKTQAGTSIESSPDENAEMLNNKNQELFIIEQLDKSEKIDKLELMLIFRQYDHDQQQHEAPAGGQPNRLGRVYRFHQRPPPPPTPAIQIVDSLGCPHGISLKEKLYLQNPRSNSKTLIDAFGNLKLRPLTQSI